MTPERRIVTGVQVRAKKDGKLGIEGYAAVFNKLSVPMWGFRERIAPGAFARALREKQDVRALQNHDANLLLGRNKNGTLRMLEDSTGLHFDVDLPDTQAARDLHALVDRGDIDQCSFSFTALKQTWIDEKDADGRMSTIRELNDVDLFDVGPVTFPAYPDTEVNVRALWPNGVPEDIRAHVPAEIRSKLDQASAELRGKTKKVAGVELTSDCFAFVGDPEDTSTWKLPIKFPGDDAKTKSHIRNALARFSQTKGIPEDKKKGVWAKIVAAAKKHDIKVSEADSIRAARAIGDAGGDGEGVEVECDCECAACQDGECESCAMEGCDDEACALVGCPMQEEDGDGGRSAEILRMKARVASID